MSRSTSLVDRVVTLVVGLALLAAGALAVVWRLDLWSELSSTTDTDAALDLTTETWWPWVLGGVGVLLVLTGLRWAWAHLPRGGVGELNLTGTNSSGRLRFNASEAASAAASSLHETPSVHSAKGTVRRDRGQLVADIEATIDPDADLAEVASAADRAVDELARVIGRDDLFGRVRLSVPARAKSSMPRAR